MLGFVFCGLFIIMLFLLKIFNWRWVQIVVIEITSYNLICCNFFMNPLFICFFKNSILRFLRTTENLNPQPIAILTGHLRQTLDKLCGVSPGPQWDEGFSQFLQVWNLLGAVQISDDAWGGEGGLGQSVRKCEKVGREGPWKCHPTPF